MFSYVYCIGCLDENVLVELLCVYVHVYGRDFRLKKINPISLIHSFTLFSSKVSLVWIV